MVAFWLLVFGLWHPAMVPSMDRDEPTPGLVAELVEAFRTSDRVLELCLSPPSPHRLKFSFGDRKYVPILTLI